MLSSSYHPTAENRITCHTYGTTNSPILTLTHEGSDLSVSVFPTEAPQVHREFARQLAEAVAQYVDATNRWADAQEGKPSSEPEPAPAQAR